MASFSIGWMYYILLLSLTHNANEPAPCFGLSYLDLEVSAITTFLHSQIPFDLSSLISSSGHMDKAPESIAILGSGAMTETAVWVTRWAKKQAKIARIHSLELLPDRLEKSIKVLNRLCEDTQHCTFEVGDIKDALQDLREHDVVYLNDAGEGEYSAQRGVSDAIGGICADPEHSFYQDHGVSSSQDPDSASCEEVATSPHMPTEWRAWEECERGFYHS